MNKLASCEMQKRDAADKEARKRKELNAVLQNVAQSPDETHADAVCFSAKRIKTKHVALDHVLMQLSSKEDKLKVFKAKGKLKGSPIGMDDLTQLQQQRKNAAWAKFKDCKARGIRAQW